MRILKPTEFHWDSSNIEKNWIKHKVDYRECEQVFFNRPLKIFEDIKHSQKEKRYAALGMTEKKRKLFIIFTLRKSKIRVISARDVSRKERSIYEKE